MLPLLLQLHSVLTSDTVLTAIIPSENIGAIVRQNAGDPSLEYGIDGEESDHSGHRILTLVFVVSSNIGAEVTYEIKERIEQLMTAKILSTPVLPSTTALDFNAVQVRLTDSRALPRTPWAHSLRIEFTLKVADKRPPTQKQ